MNEKNIVLWQNSYSVGIRVIDEQHMELIRLTNKLFASCMVGQEKSKDTFLNTIHEAVDYVRYHFGSEEKMMERINYPGYAYHKQEHASFIREVLTKVEEFNSGKIHTPLNFVYYLRDWVLHHIAVSDKELGEYLQFMKKRGDLQKITLMILKDKATGRMHIQ